MRLLFPLLILLCIPKLGWTDATPFKPDVHIHFIYGDGLKANDIDSLYLLHYESETSEADTLYHSKKVEDRWTDMYVSWYNEIVRLQGSKPYKFKIFVLVKNRWLESSWLYNYSLWAEYRIALTNDALINTTPFFKTSWSNYFIALFITISTEFLVLLLITSFGSLNKRVIPYWVIFNLVSHPVLWTLIVYTPINIMNGEWIVVLLEAIGLMLFCKEYISSLSAIVLSVFLNGISFIVGGILYMMFSIGC